MLHLVAFSIIILGLIVIILQGVLMSAVVDRIVADVVSLRTANDSIIALLDSIVAQIRDNSDDEAKLLTIADGIEAERDRIAASTLKNTPHDPNDSTTPNPGDSPPVDTPPSTPPENETPPSGDEPPVETGDSPTTLATKKSKSKS